MNGPAPVKGLSERCDRHQTLIPGLPPIHYTTMQTAITAIFQRVIVRHHKTCLGISLGLVELRHALHRPLRAQRRWRVSAVVTKPCRKGPIIGNRMVCDSRLRALLKPPASGPTVVSLLRLQPSELGQLQHNHDQLTATWELGFCVSEMMLFLKGNPTLLTDLVCRLMPGATPPRVMATRHIFCVAETSGNIQPPVRNVGLLVCPSKYWSYTSFAPTTLECENDNFATLERPSRMLDAAAATSLLCGPMNVYLRELSLALGEGSHPSR
ncbi:hypothetical protein EDB84DRAFT_1438152 [Lactarius hengduanensis]|nr:hypothetical protein EDB84DRAFT_1438152 [Lactarius hengduanensis]